MMYFFRISLTSTAAVEPAKTCALPFTTNSGLGADSTSCRARVIQDFEFEDVRSSLEIHVF